MLRFLLLLVVAAGIVGLISPAMFGVDPFGSALWWLTNTTPPRVRLEAPPGPIRGQVDIRVVGADPREADITAVLLDEQQIAPEWALSLDTASLPDGLHTLRVELRDRSLRKNAATAEVAIETDNTAPELEVQIVPSRPATGKTTVIRIRSNEKADLTGEWQGRGLSIQTGGEFNWVIVGVPPALDEPTVVLRVRALDFAGNEAMIEQTFELVQTEFPQEHVAVPEELEARLGLDVRALEDEKLAPIYKQSNGPARWQGTFLPPSTGQVSTVFGIARTYNDRDYVVHHSGADFAAAEGDDVLAANAGIVTFVGVLELRGNTLIIDHGAGVYSTYAHLSEALVRQGDEVARGDVVARVGATGLSTGPHLHWEVWASGANVDPLEWTEHEFP